MNGNFTGTKKIILIRHGKPFVLMHEYLHKKIAVKDLPALLKAYNDSDIDLSIRPKANIYEHFKEVSIAYVSKLKRSQASFNYFNLQIPYIVNELFNELEPPVIRKFPIKMSANKWLAFLRAIWFIKLFLNKKSFNNARQKAYEAAKILLESTEKSACVVLFGHGVLNYFIKKELLKMGATLNNKWECGFWGCNEFII